MATTLAIDRRDNETSAVAALVAHFPATAWLIGLDAVVRAAQAFIAQHDLPRTCAGDYGIDFPVFLAARDTSVARTYLQLFAKLDWHIGQVSTAMTEPHVAWSRVLAVGNDALPRSIFRLQAGVRYLHGEYAVDDPMRVYLSGWTPEQFPLACEGTWLEVRGEYGTVQLTRLDATTFIFRTNLAAGLPLAAAAERASAHDERFSPNSALQRVVAERLVTAVVPARSPAAVSLSFARI